MIGSWNFKGEHSHDTASLTVLHDTKLTDNISLWSQLIPLLITLTTPFFLALDILPCAILERQGFHR